MHLLNLASLLFIRALHLVSCQDQVKDVLLLTHQFEVVVLETNEHKFIELKIYKSDNITEKIDKLCFFHHLTDCEYLHSSISLKLRKLDLTFNIPAPTKINTIWMLWWQGWNNAPALVKKCLQSWQFHHSPLEYNIILLDRLNIGNFINLTEVIASDIVLQEVSLAALSDTIRWMLLYQYGGVWADATLYCHRPLSAWIDLAYYPYDTPYSHFTTSPGLRLIL